MGNDKALVGAHVDRTGRISTYLLADGFWRKTSAYISDERGTGFGIGVDLAKTPCWFRIFPTMLTEASQGAFTFSREMEKFGPSISDSLPETRPSATSLFDNFGFPKILHWQAHPCRFLWSHRKVTHQNVGLILTVFAENCAVLPDDNLRTAIAAANLGRKISPIAERATLMEIPETRRTGKIYIALNGQDPNPKHLVQEKPHRPLSQKNFAQTTNFGPANPINSSEPQSSSVGQNIPQDIVYYNVTESTARNPDELHIRLEPPNEEKNVK